MSARALSLGCFLSIGVVFTACGGEEPEDAGIDTPPPPPRDTGVDAPPPTDFPYKGPWVMAPTTESVLVRWESQLAPPSASVSVRPEAGGAAMMFAGTSTSTEVQLSYGVGTRLVTRPDYPGTYFVNEVTMTGLAPATCYLYELDGFTGEGGRFCTMHLPDDHTTPIRFYAIGDTSPAIMGTVRLIQENDPRTTEFSIHVGDIQYYSTLIESQQYWFELMAPMLEANAFLPCVGNHESEEDHEWEDIYLRLFDHPGGEAGVNAGDDGTIYYHFETGGVHFFSLSTEHPLEIGSDQYDWLVETLTAVEADPNYRFSILYLHRPLYSYGDWSPRREQVDAIDPLVRDHRIPLVLSGHMHGYERFEIDYPTAGPGGLGHATHVTTGAGGFPGTDASVSERLPTDPDAAALRVSAGAFFQSMIIEIVPSGDGTADLIQATTLDDLGATRDSFEISVPR
jgi:hypothetical protein